MNEDDIKEVKLIAMSMAKLGNFCKRYDDCDKCPLSYYKAASNPCALQKTIPSEWDIDKAIYFIGLEAGRRESK